MKNPIGMIGLVCRCFNCKGKYDLSKEKRKAEAAGEQKIKCPYCGHIIGEIQGG
jgi:DNA-directed RNA polymerase subunit RPC12/RpoP